MNSDWLLGIAMDFAETSVLHFLTRNGLAFVCPQFELEFDGSVGGNSPDFVALDLLNQDLAVVEVTTAANIEGLIARIIKRKSRWYHPIENHMRSWPGLADHSLMPRFIGFIREELIHRAYDAFPNQTCNDVTFVPLERCLSPWRYWTERGHNDDMRMPDAGRAQQRQMPWSREYAQGKICR